MRGIRYSHRLIGLIALVAVALGTHAAPHHTTDLSGINARAGIWRGTIGRARVMVCLGPNAAPSSYPRYYYLRHRFSIELAFTDRTGTTLREAEYASEEDSKPTGVWTLQPPAGTRMDGVWTMPDRSRSLPIHLVRIATLGTASDANCDYRMSATARRLFNAPRVAAQKLVTKQLAHGLRKVSALDGSISTTLLPASIHHAADFNRAMKAQLSENIAGAYNCAFSAGRLSGPGGWETHSSLSLLSPTWITVKEEFSDYCGGAHGGYGVAHHVWNLATGKKANPWQFIKTPRLCDRDQCGQTLPPKLLAIVNERYKQTNGGGCSDVMPDDDTFYSPYPGKRGMFIKVEFGSSMVQGCSLSILVPWKTVEPFLTRQGKAMMRSIRHHNPVH